MPKKSLSQKPSSDIAYQWDTSRKQNKSAMEAQFTAMEVQFAAPLPSDEKDWKEHSSVNKHLSISRKQRDAYDAYRLDIHGTIAQEETVNKHLKEPRS